MANINVITTLQNGSQCQIVVKVGGKTLHFKNSGTQSIQLNNQNYRALIAGFLEPGRTDSTVKVVIKQGTSVLNSIEISESKFIKYLDINVK